MQDRIDQPLIVNPSHPCQTPCWIPFVWQRNCGKYMGKNQHFSHKISTSYLQPPHKVPIQQFLHMLYSFSRQASHFLSISPCISFNFSTSHSLGGMEGVHPDWDGLVLAYFSLAHMALCPSGSNPINCPIWWLHLAYQPIPLCMPQSHTLNLSTICTEKNCRRRKNWRLAEANSSSPVGIAMTPILKAAVWSTTGADLYSRLHRSWIRSICLNNDPRGFDLKFWSYQVWTSWKVPY